MGDDLDVKGLLDEVERNRMPLLEHLRELRTRLIWSIVALSLGMAASLGFAEQIYNWLTAPFIQAIASSGVSGGLSMVNSPFEGVYTYLWVAFIGGLAIASPMVTLQIWLFVAPGLYSSEKRLVVPLAASSTLLFASGALFCYYLIFPYAFPWFLQVIDVQANLSVAGYLEATLKMMGAFGLSFQLPIVVFVLARMGLIDHRDMIDYIRYATVAIFVVAAIITPPDVLTQLLLSAPLMALYVVSIGVAWAFTTKVREAPATAGS